MKIEVLRDWSNEVIGYKLGNYVLAKEFGWHTDYSWIITSAEDFEGDSWNSFWHDDKLAILNKEHRIIYPCSCKRGKEILRELASGVDFESYRHPWQNDVYMW